MRDADTPGSPEYLDFELEIGQVRGRRYPLAVLHSPAGEARATMIFPFDRPAFTSHLKDLQIALLRSSVRTRRLLSTEEDSVRRFGQALHNALLNGAIRSRYDESLAAARDAGRRVRLRLRTVEPAMAAVPWEFLYDERLGEYAVLSRAVSLVRYLEVAHQAGRTLTVTGPLRVLGMVASPAGLQKLDIEKEKRALETALARVVGDGRVAVSWVPGSTWRDLQRAMRGGPWHIFHFIGHGGFDANADEGVLALADDDGHARLLRASQIGTLLAGHPSLRLVLLNSCEGARVGEHDLFSGTATTLVLKGVPAVIAMQYEITDEAAIEFSRSLYEALADGWPVDAAVDEARIGVNSAVATTLEWGTPVLFMRSADGVLFSMAGEARGYASGPPPAIEATPTARRASEGQPAAVQERTPHVTAAAPEAEAPARAAGNLPVALTSFVGRERELAELEQLLLHSRLLTLTGPGGCGKTRLALEAAGRAAGFAGGVCLVELAPCNDAALIPQYIAAALVVQEESGRPLQQTLVAALRAKRMVLLLDNCEHLVRDCAELAESLLHACPELHILATSRESLGITGEVIWRVPSLSLPENAPASVEAFAGYDAVRLFVERAAAVQRGFHVTERNAAAVAQICRTLDGIPLALELAAGVLSGLTVEQIAGRLNDRFSLLVGRAALPRHRTLLLTMDWSYDLLTPAEQLLLQRLSIFSGGCTLEAAESVCAGSGIAAGDVLGLLIRLVNKSLVQRAEDDEVTARYSLLETVRQYGRRKLQEMLDEERLRDRHVAWCLSLAQAGAPAAEAVARRRALDRLEIEQDNLRAALEWCLNGEGRQEAGLRLAAALGDFWLPREHLSEGRRWLEGLLALPGAVPPAIRAKSMLNAGVLAFNQGDYARGRMWLEESLSLYRSLGDRSGIAEVTCSLGVMAGNERDLALARQLLEEGLAIYRALNDGRATARALSSLAFWTGMQGDHEAARARYEEALALYRSLGDRAGVASTLQALAAHVDDLATAESSYSEALAIWRDLGMERGTANTLADLAGVASRRGDLAAAGRRLREALDTLRSGTVRRQRADILGRLSLLARWQGDYPRARVLTDEAGQILRELEDRWGLVWHLFDGEGMLALAEGRYGEARKACEDALAVGREIGTKWGTTWALDRLAQVYFAQGDLGAARRLREECLAIMRSLGSDDSLSYLLFRFADVLLKQGDVPAARAACDEAIIYLRRNGVTAEGSHVLRKRAEVARVEGDYATASAIYEESLSLCRKAGMLPSVATTLDGLGVLAREQGNAEQAVALLRRSLAMYRAMGLRRDVIECLEKLAPAFTEQDEPERAAHLFGAAASLRGALGAPMPPIERPEHDRLIAITRDALDEQRFWAAWAAGEGLDEEGAIALAGADAPVEGSGS